MQREDGDYKGSWDDLEIHYKATFEGYPRLSYEEEDQKNASRWQTR